jgi:hypothetical protein
LTAIQALEIFSLQEGDNTPIAMFDDLHTTKTLEAGLLGKTNKGHKDLMVKMELV